ncbi:tetratricopeptide repeat protein [Thiovibrio sp. JS02]
MSRRSRELCGRLSRLVILLALVCVMTSCAPQKKVAIPVYREEPRVQAQPVPSVAEPAPPQPQAQPERTPETVPEVAPEIPHATQIPPPPGQAGALLASANKAMQAGQPDKAEMHLERALRLAPRDAQLWHGMAKVRFGQGNYSQAVQFCLKSNSLAGKNGAVIRQNWLLMEKAHLKMGNKEKAAQARQKADGF